MLKLLNSEQTRQADLFTIKSRSVTSLDLMESAAFAFVTVFTTYYTFRDIPVSIYCGTGNNGGDGLAIARLLKENGYDRVSVKIARYNNTVTDDFQTNLERLHLTGIPVSEIMPGGDLPPEEAVILIDALLGSGLSGPLRGDYQMLVQYLNGLGKPIVAVDVPSGFPGEGIIAPESTIIKAHLVISFQRPKINFYFPESAPFVEKFRFIDIGLDEQFIQAQPGGWEVLESDDIRDFLSPRAAFSHKGTYGHALIIAGSAATMGAALLCADACVHAGAGLTTACIPEEGLSALNSRSPAVMALIRAATADERQNYDLLKYQAIAIGPGLGTAGAQTKLLEFVLDNARSPLVMDADALNILSLNPGWLNRLPSGTILTPHMKEFDRLFGEHQSWWERVEKGREVALHHQVIIILKNQYSFIILPDGKVVINPTGNPAMAVGGMGDVLTGIIAALLAQGFEPQIAAFIACYLHGKAGDMLHEKGGMYCIPPQVIIKKMPEVIGSFILPGQVI